MTHSPLVDGFGRVHTDLRVSVTDRCNLRCTYCMPLDVVFKPRSELLSFEEIERVVRVAVARGIRSVRLTGGEPLVRRDLDLLVRALAGIDGLEDLSLTTNGLLLAVYWAWDAFVAHPHETTRDLARDARLAGRLRIGPLAPATGTDPGQPAVDYRYADGGGLVGFIDPVSQPFCDRCDRLRLTADGQFRNCLFSTTEWDVRSVLRDGGDDGEIARLLEECVAAKRAGHGIGDPEFERPARAMYQIGG